MSVVRVKNLDLMSSVERAVPGDALQTLAIERVGGSDFEVVITRRDGATMSHTFRGIGVGDGMVLRAPE